MHTTTVLRWSVVTYVPHTVPHLHTWVVSSYTHILQLLSYHTPRYTVVGSDLLLVDHTLFRWISLRCYTFPTWTIHHTHTFGSGSWLFFLTVRGYTYTAVHTVPHTHTPHVLLDVRRSGSSTPLVTFTFFHPTTTHTTTLWIVVTVLHRSTVWT